jgi:hypothetical protein
MADLNKYDKNTQLRWNETQRQKNLALGFVKVTVLVPEADRDRLLKVAQHLRDEASNEG